MSLSGAAARLVPEKEGRLEALLGKNAFARRIEARESEKVRAMIGANEICDKVFDDEAVRFEMYVAYWRPGNSELREAYAHIPDACWSLAGWTCAEGASGKRYNVAGLAVRPAEWRRFVGASQSQEVIYWCLIGGRAFPFRYEPEATKRRLDRYLDARALVEEQRFTLERFVSQSEFLSYWNRKLQGVDLRQGQAGAQTVREDTYFIRLNSEQPIETLLGNAMFREQVGKLAALGLAEP